MSESPFFTPSLVAFLVAQMTCTNLGAQTTYKRPPKDPDAQSQTGGKKTQKGKPKKQTFEDFVEGAASTPTPSGAADPDVPQDGGPEEGQEAPRNPRQKAPQNRPQNTSQEPGSKQAPLPVYDPSAPRAPIHAGTREGNSPPEMPLPEPSPGSKVQFTPLVIEAAIHRVVSFPLPFQNARIVLPMDGTRLELANAIVSAQHPSPFEATVEFAKQGMPTKSVTLNAPLGWTAVVPPAGYDGSIVTVKCPTPLIAWRILLIEQALFGIDRQLYFRRFVAPVGSKFRVDIQSMDTIPWDDLPANPKAIAEHPVLGKPWKAFIDSAMQAKM